MLLIACPKCSRQYDVTHLPPQSKIRCACDTAFEVTWRRPFVVAHLQCGNCAGPVAPEDDACRFCGSALPERERRQSALCPQCFARIEVDSRHCRACGTEIRPQALTPIPDGRSCPRCQGELAIRVLEQDEVIECTQCSGAWLDARAFERVCGRARARATGTPVTAPPGSAQLTMEDKVSYIPCMSCGEIMLRKQYRQDGRSSGVIVDYCKDHGIWLDPQELEHILDFLTRLETRANAGTGSGLRLGAPRQVPEPRTSGGGGRRRVTGWGLRDAIDLIGDIFFEDLI